MPSRNGYVTANTCLICDRAMPTGRARTTCSDACRQHSGGDGTNPNLPRPAPRQAVRRGVRSRSTNAPAAAPDNSATSTATTATPS